MCLYACVTHRPVGLTEHIVLSSDRRVGHHVYADAWREFNAAIVELLRTDAPRL